MTNRRKNENECYPSALTIAGSDSGGGAGIQADLRTFNAFGVFGCSAITAITSQNPAAVRRIDPIPPEGVSAQIDAVLEKISIRGVKSGMLFSPEIVEAVAAAVRRHRLLLVCDPVMVSTSGAALLREEAVRKMSTELLPEARWITPNLPEAELLLGRKIGSEAEAFRAAHELYDRFGAAIVLKGGHAAGAEAGDIVCREGKLYRLSSPRLVVPPHADHGTGCTFSAALAAAFALGTPWKQALCDAKEFVLGSLAENVRLGTDVYGMYPPRHDRKRTVRFEEVGE